MIKMVFVGAYKMEPTRPKLDWTAWLPPTRKTPVGGTIPADPRLTPSVGVVDGAALELPPLPSKWCTPVLVILIDW